MDDAVFGVIPSRHSGPLPLAGQETSPLFEFPVSAVAEQVFIRVIALFRDMEPLGGEAPTFQIRAGRGVITSVGPDSGEVIIPGGDRSPVGTLRCEREPNDIFLITIADIVENSGPWKIRIRNDDPETLRFLGFSSRRKDDTRQPWMQLTSSRLEFVRGDTKTIEVRNLGTRPLIIDEEAGPIGDPDFGLRLESLPKGDLDPHQVGLITFKTTEIERSGGFDHTLRCNDTIEAHATLSLAIRTVIP